jgi:hypothetical protein
VGRFEDLSDELLGMRLTKIREKSMIEKLTGDLKDGVSYGK